MPTSTWYANATFIASEPFTEDAPFDVTDRLVDIAAVMSVSRDFTGGTVAVTIDAPTVTEAASAASTAISEALTAEGIAHTMVGVQVQSEGDFLAELERPIYPEVVGYAEIAAMAGVSRQRARQYAEKDSFPSPVIETAQGPLMSKHAIERWLESRHVHA